MADNGIAGHWLYKSAVTLPAQPAARARQWVRDLLDLQQRAGNPMEFIESLKIDLFPDEVYVFTPEGRHHGAAARRVRRRLRVRRAHGHRQPAASPAASIATWRRCSQLQSGQTVEIITAQDARPNPDWLTFVVSSKARTGIRQALKDQQAVRSRSPSAGACSTARSPMPTRRINDLDFRRLRRVFKEFGVRR